MLCRLHRQLWKEVNAKKKCIHEEEATGEIVNRVQGIILSSRNHPDPAV